MAKIKKLKLLSFAKLQAIIFGIAGMIAGIIYAFGGLAIDALVSSGWISSAAVSTPGLSYGTALAFGALIGMPIIFASFGFFLGLAEAVLYNLYSQRFGGVALDFE